MNYLASVAFGLESVVKRDLDRVGAKNIRVLNTGGISFEGDWEEMIRANLYARAADRILLTMGRFEARSFEELFQGVRRIDWKELLPKDARFPVRAQCARSALMSPSDCQSIAKKAVVESLRAAYGVTLLPESGPQFQIDVAIHEDLATISLDASGAALNRRGYRTWNGEAPIRETLGAALVLLSPWHPAQALYDPCCGTGTLLIEAAYIALDRAPGLTRGFAFEEWPAVPKELVERLRAEARERAEAGFRRKLDIAGSDIDEDALKLCRLHIAQAGLEGRLRVEKADMRDIKLPEPGGVILANPPYGRRLGDRAAALKVAKALGDLKRRSPGWQLSAISGDAGFERAFGRRADKRRRLYNGRLECEFLTFGNGER